MSLFALLCWAIWIVSGASGAGCPAGTPVQLIGHNKGVSSNSNVGVDSDDCEADLENNYEMNCDYTVDVQQCDFYTTAPYATWSKACNCVIPGVIIPPSTDWSLFTLGNCFTTVPGNPEAGYCQVKTVSEATMAPSSSVPTGQPTSQPFAQPSTRPTSQPSSAHPSGQPSTTPSVMPSGQPSAWPSSQPSSQPSGQPSSSVPSTQPFAQPSSRPSGQPSGEPSGQPSGQPSTTPSGRPTGEPTSHPTDWEIVPAAAPAKKNPPSFFWWYFWIFVLFFLLGLLCCGFCALLLFLYRRRYAPVVAADGRTKPKLVVQKAMKQSIVVPTVSFGVVSTQVTPRTEEVVVPRPRPEMYDVGTAAMPRPIVEVKVAHSSATSVEVGCGIGLDDSIMVDHGTQCSPRAEAPRATAPIVSVIKRGTGARRDKAAPQALLFEAEHHSSSEESGISESSDEDEEMGGGDIFKSWA